MMLALNGGVVTRRRFCSLAAGASAGMFLPGLAGIAGPFSQARPLSLGYLSAPGNDAGRLAAACGAALGIEESRRTAQLLNRDVRLSSRTADADGLGAALRELAGEGVAAVAASGDDAWTARAASEADRRGVLLLNTGCCSDALRSNCLRSVFHVQASEAMYHAAAAGAGPSAPDSPPGENVTPALWHSTLTRFGAEQLNQRFERHFARPMDSSAWAAWVAIKILWESSLRVDRVSAERLAEWLTQPAARFDGHKGTILTFRPRDHQLRQPLYLVKRDAVVGEFPRNGDLDSPGEKEPSQPCRA